MDVVNVDELVKSLILLDVAHKRLFTKPSMLTDDNRRQRLLLYPVRLKRGASLLPTITIAVVYKLNFLFFPTRLLKNPDHDQGQDAEPSDGTCGCGVTFLCRHCLKVHPGYGVKKRSVRRQDSKTEKKHGLNFPSPPVS